MRCKISLVRFLLAVSTASAAQAAPPPHSLSEYLRPDGKREAYYAAGDPYLELAFQLINDYWNKISTSGRSLLRGHLDNYLPLELKRLEHKPAEAMMRSFADSFFASAHPKTGLISYSYKSFSPVYLAHTGGRQPVYLVARGEEFLQWFPDDKTLLEKNLALAAATVKYFDFHFETDSRNVGLASLVDVETGRQESIIALAQDYGAVGRAMAELSRKTGKADLAAWADKKLQFVWQHRLNADLPILNVEFTPTAALMNDGGTSDTDTLYYVRQLFDIYHITGDAKYRDWAMAVTDLWYERAWVPEWGQFIRKLRPDGSPAVDSLYGDAKYNTLHILVHAYRVTKDAKYLERQDDPGTRAFSATDHLR
ncbi:MAG: hypothetical protein HUU20_19700 [Pirellulales bacterium]|nr:hypothetical protein [Pirellulales bacterium]